jgi:hypothetical protein
MLSSFFQPRIVERIARSDEGRLFRVLVEVAYVNQRYYWRILRIEPVLTLDSQKKPFLVNSRRLNYRMGSVPGCFAALLTRQRARIRFLTLVISPYFNQFQFFFSQMPRAPSVASHLSGI